MTTYPNCEKLAEHREEYVRIIEFIEWLQEEKNVALMKPVGYVIGHDLQELFYEYIGVDSNELERERRAILDAHIQEGLNTPSKPFNKEKLEALRKAVKDGEDSGEAQEFTEEDMKQILMSNIAHSKGKYVLEDK